MSTSILEPVATERPAKQGPAEAIRDKFRDGTVSVRSTMRAFGVVVGPSLTADVLGAASIGATAKALRRGRTPAWWAIAGTTATGVYTTVARPWLRRWGATPEKLEKPLPGDEMVPRPALQSTRAVTIDAPVQEVWPWLAQIGQDRAGFYSYAWLENLAGCGIHNADRVHPEWQHRSPGDQILLHPSHGQPVTRFEPFRSLALEGWGAFVLEPLPGDRTRLIVRSRVARGPGHVAYALLVELPHFVMERKMLLGLKRRAEHTHMSPRSRRSEGGR
jgi:hypothetical protein